MNFLKELQTFLFPISAPTNGEPTGKSEMVTRTAGAKMIFNETFDGEKNPDELGPIKNYLTDNFSLAARTKQAYLESDIAKTVIDRFVLWCIGSGLKFQAEPLTELLRLEGVDNPAEVENQIDPYWNRFANSPEADYSKEKASTNWLRMQQKQPCFQEIA